MKVYEISYPDEKYGDITECLTETGILEAYYAHWSAKMMRIGKSPEITEQNCIDDFIVVHWATEVK